MKALKDTIELLEPRIAPASVSITYIDVDGDLVKITAKNSLSTAPPLDATDLSFVGGAMSGQLAVLNLASPGFADANISFSVAKRAGGNGTADVGRIDATGTTLGVVKVKGDLGAIDAGDGSGRAIKSLVVRSMGLLGLATQGGVGDLRSDIAGTLGSLKVAGDVKEANIVVDAAGASVGKVTIGGSLIGGLGTASGTIFSSGDLGPVKIGDHIIGGSGLSSGQVSSGGKLLRLDVGGSLIGGFAAFSAAVMSRGGAGPVSIGGSVLGGVGNSSGIVDIIGSLASIAIRGSLIGSAGNHIFFDSPANVGHEGQIFASGNIGSVNVGGDVYGSDGDASGEIRAKGIMGSVKIGGSLIGGSGLASGHVASEGPMGNVRIGGNIIGGPGVFTGWIESFSNLGNVTVLGSIIGGAASNSGLISSIGDMGKVKLGGNLQGGSILGNVPGTFFSGGIYAFGGGIAKVTIGGSVIAGVDGTFQGSLMQNGSLGAFGEIGSITVKGSLLGNVTPLGVTPVIISAGAESSETDLAIGKISIGGRVERALILGGYQPSIDPSNTAAASSNGNARIGPVTVGGDWIASSISAGVRDAGNNGFGNLDDVVIPGADGDDVFSRIASIRIKGAVVGSSAAGDHFGFTAQQIGFFEGGGIKAVLNSSTNAPLELSLLTGDVTLREV